MEPGEFYDACVEKARAMLPTLDNRLTYCVENAEAIDLGIFVGVTGAITWMVENGWLDD